VDTDTVWRHIDAERAWMADLLESLPEESWRRPSACAGWTVRDVGAHVAQAQSGVRDVLGPAIRAGFRYDAMVRDTALRSPLSHAEIIATIRGFLGSRRRVAFIFDLEPLIDVLVHNQDIARPLGVEHPVPRRRGGRGGRPGAQHTQAAAALVPSPRGPPGRDGRRLGVRRGGRGPPPDG
jgi:uncharacterized protein (TIGR03083 family)